MTTYIKYRIRCNTENKYVQCILNSTDPIPTTCPNNTNHIIDNNDIVSIGTINESIVTIKEESVPTGGNFKSDSVELNISQNSTSSYVSFYPFKISALNVRFTTSTDHIDDEISICVGPDIPIGVCVANINPANAWTTQNYTVGQIVSYTHPKYGSRIYTCILNTINNESPVNTLYWRHGYEILVNSTVMEYTMIGYYLKISDGTNINDLGRVLHKNLTNNKIYVENNLINTFTTSVPLYIMQTIYLLKNYKIGLPHSYTIGDSKIGGQSIPIDVPVTITYKNNGNTAKK